MKALRALTLLSMFCVAVIFCGCIGLHDGTTEKEYLHLIFWIDDHTVLLHRMDTDENWIYALKSGRLVKLPDRRGSHIPQPAPSGEYLLATGWKFDHLSIVKTAQASEDSAVRHFPMPQMPSVDDDVEKAPIYNVFWISDKQIYLEQLYFNSGRFQCRLFDIDDQRWTTPPHCFELQHFGSSPGRVYALGNDLYTGFGSDEGWVSVAIVKWTPETGILKTDFPQTSLGLGAPSAIYSENDGSRIYLLTPLTFQGHLAQGDLIADYTSRDRILYRWTKEKGFEETGIVLPAHIALRSVKSKITAWVDDDEEKICLGHLERKVICRNFPVPIPAP